MSVSSDPGCAGKKSHKRMGGMAEAVAVAIASDLGFLINQVQDRIIARLQQPYSLDYVSVEAEIKKC